MKQKNLILIAIAVVCGLVAAVLTSRMSAGGSKVKPEDFVEVPVAAKDIPIGTKILAKDVELWIVKKKFPKDAVPPAFVSDTQELVDKRTMRPIRQGETINPADISATGFLAPPAGHVLLSAPINLERGASGFALPGARVIVIATKKSVKLGKEIVFPLFLDALVLAVDTSPTAPQANPNDQSNGGGSNGSGNGFKTMSMFSLAVTPEDSVLLSMAADSATLRLALPPQDEKEKEKLLETYTKLRPSPEQIRKIFADELSPENDQNGPTPGARVETVTVIVPTEPIEVGTHLTAEVLGEKFQEIEFPKEYLPGQVATTEAELLNKYVTVELLPKLLTPTTHLAKSPPKKETNPVVGTGVISGVKVDSPDVDVATPKAETDGTPQQAKKEYVFVTVHTAQGKKIYKYEVKPNGQKIPLGEVTPGLEDDTK
jgi:Flp pilus assembly protein CpaB